MTEYGCIIINDDAAAPTTNERRDNTEFVKVPTGKSFDEELFMIFSQLAADQPKLANQNFLMLDCDTDVSTPRSDVLNLTSINTRDC